MADLTKVWDKAFSSGSKALQDRLKKVHGNKPEFQAFLKSRGLEGGERSASQATTSLKKATDSKIAAQKIADMRYKKALQASSERVREMGRRRRESGEGLGGGLNTAKEVIAHIQKYGSIKAGRLGEDTFNKYGHPKGVDVDPTASDKPGKELKKKPAKYTHPPHMEEQIEKIDEIKLKDVLIATHGKSPEEKQKIIKAMRDQERASKPPMPKRAPEKIDYDPTDRGYGQGRYMGDNVNLEGPLMNEVSKKEAEAMLGGPVKDKPKMPPGKQPAGYRYVRGLARKAMKAGLKKEEVELTEAPKSEADVGEYDYEGDMAMSQLKSILTNAKKLHDMMEPNTNLPEWVQSKITLAEDYIVTAANYMEGKMNEEVELDEAQKKLKPSYWRAEWRLGTQSEVDKNNKKIFDKLAKTDPVKAAAFHDNLMKMKKKDMNEKVEQVDEISEPYGTKKLRRQMAIDDRMAARAAAHPFVEPEWLTKEKEKAKQAAEKEKVKKEEVVAEAEGKVAVTPKEKELAAHHGDKTKITYGDVIKARIKSAKEKALKGNK